MTHRLWVGGSLRGAPDRDAQTHIRHLSNPIDNGVGKVHERYPARTPQIMRKILGLRSLKAHSLEANASRQHFGRDEVEIARASYQPEADLYFQTFGPMTRRNFLNLMRRTGSDQA